PGAATGGRRHVRPLGPQRRGHPRRPARGEPGGRAHRRGGRRGRSGRPVAGRRPTMANHVQVRRAYDPPEPGDGQRVLVDRLWPRGLSKERADLTEWCKDVAPSTELRKWYGHDPDRFAEFARRYRAELAEPEQAAALDHLKQLARNGPLTLLTAAKRSDISE